MKKKRRRKKVETLRDYIAFTRWLHVLPRTLRMRGREQDIAGGGRFSRCGSSTGKYQHKRSPTRPPLPNTLLANPFPSLEAQRFPGSMRTQGQNWLTAEVGIKAGDASIDNATTCV